MPIHRLLEHEAFEPDAVAVMASAFERSLLTLGLTDRTDPLTTIVAKRIIELARRGERDPIRLHDYAVKPPAE
jgi:hypothetical protein